MPSDTVTKLPELERAWMNAWVAKDRATCEDILDDESSSPVPEGYSSEKPNGSPEQ